jgi:diacylglycerol kinase family enzyme
MRALLVVNPHASAVTEKRAARVAEVLRPDEIVRTERPGHATELVRAACGSFDAVHVYSGDGGFNEALNGVDGDTPLGFVPGGGASVLARALGLRRDPVAAAQRLAHAQPRRISVGRANGRRFGFAAGLGFDAEVVRRVDERGRRRDGRRVGNLTFAWIALRALAERRFRIAPAIELSGEGRVAFVLAANTDPYTYAGPAPLHVAPRASFELGLDIVAPRALRPLTVPRFLAYATAGRGQEGARDVVYLHDVDGVEARCDAPMPLHVDGEDMGDVEEVSFEAERGAVLVLA